MTKYLMCTVMWRFSSPKSITGILQYSCFGFWGFTKNSNNKDLGVRLAHLAEDWRLRRRTFAVSTVAAVHTLRPGRAFLDSYGLKPKPVLHSLFHVFYIWEGTGGSRIFLTFGALQSIIASFGAIFWSWTLHETQTTLTSFRGNLTGTYHLPLTERSARDSCASYCYRSRSWQQTNSLIENHCITQA